jgi:hypothetical protein
MAKKPQRATKKPSGAGDQRKRLEAELKEAIRQIDEEGLLFLLQQAHILVHNARVDRLNEELTELRQKKRAGRGSAAEQKPARTRSAVSIDEAEGGKAFFLTLGGARKVMDLEEMRRLVRICYAAESKSAALKQMYTVFAKERSDILADAGIAGPTSPVLDALFYAVRSRYQLKED